MRIIPIFLVALAVGNSAIGQEAAPVPVEAAPKNAGRVYVMHAGSGEEIRGHLLQLAPESLTILVDGQRRTVPLDDVLRIQVAGDSVKNGALIGAIVFAAYCACICGQGLDSVGQVPLAVAFSAGYGAAVGAGIDAAISGRTTIYRKNAGSTAGFAAMQAGVSFRLRF